MTNYGLEISMKSVTCKCVRPRKDSNFMKKKKKMKKTSANNKINLSDIN